MKKGQVCEGIVRRVDFPNKGIVETDEGTAVVKTGLPGQKVKFIVNKMKNGKAEGRLLEVLEKSPLETGHPCSHFGLCGGCNYLSMPYQEQLAIKEDQVKRLLDRVLSKQERSWQWEGIKGSPAEYEYRNKMEFSFGDEVKDGPLALGMHKRGSFYDVVTVEDCRIVDADYRLILKTVRDYFDANGVSFHHKMSHQGFLRHLLVRKASKTGEILVALVTSSQNPEGHAVQELITGFKDLLLGLEQTNQLKGKIAGILHIINDSLADVVQSDHTEVLYGQEYFFEELLGLKFKISTFSFFQTNSHSAEVLYETVREYVGDIQETGTSDKVVFDLYSGTGTIAQLMAPAAKKVVGVEIVEEAVEVAKKNAAENGLTNCEFIAGDVLKVLDEIPEKPDLIILDPPRDGCHPKVLPKILGYGVEKIVYVSCKPTSLVRDLEVFLEQGYVVEKAVAVDQFPWTANIEVVSLLQRMNNTREKTSTFDV
ncbi:MAG: 23S rRNA (uracil(1939)-C(5))-methyltransferase RlmD [Lachnospiraceae bacterium]|nr:23S rRNA (uracil(1939)-C(5))-methyltransferase RlmD [Lachnospiraceae bacterium]